MNEYNVTAVIVHVPNDSVTMTPIEDHRTFGPFENRDEAERTITALAGRSNVIDAKLWTTDAERKRIAESYASLEHAAEQRS